MIMSISTRLATQFAVQNDCFPEQYQFDQSQFDAIIDQLFWQLAKQSNSIPQLSFTSGLQYAWQLLGCPAFSFSNCAKELEVSPGTLEMP